MKWSALPGRELVQKIRSSTLTWWTLALFYYVTCCLSHLQFSLWLVRQRDTLFGRRAYADAVPGLAVLAGVCLVLWLVLSVRKSLRPWTTGAYWLLWLLAFALIDRYLTYSTNEYAHYPQYGLLALLVARAMDPLRSRWYVGRVLFWTTLMGIGDELLQYLWITISYSEYLDFIDFLANLVAAAAGMLLYYGTAAQPMESVQRRKPVVETVVALVLTGVVVVGLLTGRVVPTPTEKIPPGGIVQRADGSRQLYLQRGPDFYGSWQSSHRHERYYVLPPVPALSILLLTGLIFASYARARKIRHQSADL